MDDAIDLCALIHNISQQGNTIREIARVLHDCLGMLVYSIDTIKVLLTPVISCNLKNSHDIDNVCRNIHHKFQAVWETPGYIVDVDVQILS